MREVEPGYRHGMAAGATLAALATGSRSAARSIRRMLAVALEQLGEEDGIPSDEELLALVDEAARALPDDGPGRQPKGNSA